MINFFKTTLFSILIGAAAYAAAHKYFFAITNLNNNADSKQLEIIHQLTGHDLENAIAQIEGITFNAEHPQYETIIKKYIEQHFQLVKKNELLPMTWVGLEADRDKIVIYQQAPYQNFLTSIVVKNDLLVDTYATQVNTVNYESLDLRGSLTFNQTQRIRHINKNN